MDVGNSDSASQPVTAFLTREVARSLALEAGFAEAGLVALPHAAEALEAARFAEWIEAGRAGTMGYLSRTNEEGQLVRSRVAIPFPWARSAVVCFARYGSAEPLSTEPAAKRSGWIARYAWSSRVTRRSAQAERLSQGAAEAIAARWTRGCMSDAANLNRAPTWTPDRWWSGRWPRLAGLGWTGKNTCLIHPKLGSYGFLAVLLTSLQVLEESPELTVPDRLRKLPALPGRMPDGRADCALPDGCDALHLVPDHRAQRDRSLRN